jgi:restriction system protein
LSAPRHGVFTITDRGKSVLAKNPPRIDRSFLEQLPEFLAFSGKSKTGLEADLVQLKPPAGIETPLESLEIAYEKIRKELKIELLDPRSLQIFVLICLLIKPERGVRSSAKQLSG